MPKEINKIVLGDTSIIDLMQVNATPSDVIKGRTFHKADGSIGTGTAVLGATVSGSRISVPGKTFVPSSWADGTDEEIAAMVRAHYDGKIKLSDYWSVGDERVVSLSAMEATGVEESHAAQNVVFVLSNVGGKYLADGVTECAFQVDQKNTLNETGYMNSTMTNIGGWKDSARRTWCNSVYKNAIPSTLRGIFKEFINQSGTGGSSSSGVEDTTDTFALRAEIEIFGSRSYSVSGEGSQVTYYQTSSNRIKQANGSNSAWWGRSPKSGNSYRFCYVNTSGRPDYDGAYDGIKFAPFGVI